MDSQNIQQLDTTKKRVFSIIVFFIPILIILLLEIFLRIFNYGGDQRLFVTGPEKQISHYWMCNQNVGKRYFYMLGSTPSPPKDLFLKEKPKNGYRIFVLGGSTTAGFPYGYNLMFPRIINIQLSEMFPDKHIEIVNTAMSAVNSYTMLDFMDEILAKEPDAILIYAGHNEYYGAMGIGSQESIGGNPNFIRTFLKLTRFKTFLLVRNIVGSLKKGISKARSGGTEIDPTNTLMTRIVGEQKIPYKSDMYNLGLQQYEKNLRDIFEKAQRNNIPVIMSELICNIKDQPPFISTKSDSFPTADRAYTIGRQLLEQGNLQDARTALYLAKDLDALRFRASEDFNETIHRLGREYDVPVVPLKKIFQSHCKENIIGNELILEHLHPNAKGYFIMAEAFMRSMKTNNIVSDSWESPIRPIAEMMKNWGWTEIDTVSANLSIHYLKGGWPFQPEIKPNHALENYFPNTRAESLAVRILTEKAFSMTVGHVSMAEYYESKKQFDKAFKEYRAAYYTIPHEMEFYEKAVTNLLRLQRPNDAFRVLNLSHRYGSTPIINKWTGQLLAGVKQFSRALPYLEKARLELPNDRQILTALVVCYENSGEQQKAKQMRTEYGISDMPPALSSAGENSAIYETLIKQAQVQIRDKKYKEALPILRQAHSIKPSVFTYKWIGLMYLHFGHVEESTPYLEKAIELDPVDFETHYNLCNAYVILERKQDAMRLLKALQNLRPGFNDPQDLKNRVAKLNEKKKNDDSINSEK